MTPRFIKVHSLGNDYLLLDEQDWGEIQDLAGFVRRICDRHRGVGSDGVALVRVTDRAGGRAGFRVFNPDGSEAEISGNGLRCAAAGLFFQGKAEKSPLFFTTLAGVRECGLVSREGARFEVRVEMGLPRFASKDIPFDDDSAHERLVDHPLTICGRVRQVTLVSIGNPHCVLFVDRFPPPAEWRQMGSEIESHPYFPRRTNVELVRVVSRDEIEVRFWERGVGETLASGSGSTGAAVAAAVKGLTGRSVKVVTALGSLRVDWAENSVYQTGPAEVVFEGTPAWIPVPRDQKQ